MARKPQPEEERLPHDGLEGVPLPRQTQFLVGHKQAEHSLLEAYRSGRMHHGWILSGERGIGKATLAFRFARFLFAHPDPAAPDVAFAGDLAVPSDNPAARRVAVGSHANLLHAEREWNDRDSKYRIAISVETVRRINHFLGNTAGEGGWRVVIVDPADDMTPSAANALLKNLEEPPKQTVFLLLARRRGALLPTILSRCRVLELASLSATEIAAILADVSPDAATEKDGGLAAALAGGSVRRLWDLRRSDGVTLYRQMIRALDGDASAQSTVAALAGDPQATQQLLELFRDYLSRRIRGLPEPASDTKPPEAPLVTWAELWDKATLSGRDVETYNLDRRQFVLDLVESTAAAVRRGAA